jgi:predicted RecA/RadA family phage recombinase
MAVNLSPVGGVAAQFFDNSGQVLTGGLLYSYLAGTTTPAVTYTTSAGITAHSNPIVLDAAGRVPNSGEIWLTDSISYKFVLQTSAAVQIATWDNVSGINSNFVTYGTQTQTITATQSQTVFTLTTVSYTPAANTLSVFVNGSKQILTTNYVETSSTVVTFVDGLNVGDLVQFTTVVSTNVNPTNAGTTAQRPTTGRVPGLQFYDTTLGIPIWWNGTVWKNAAGTTV